MSNMTPGSIGWHDLTVPDAEGVRDFYAGVVGWTAEALDMGGYSDFCMQADGQTVAGVCHARGANAAMPALWMMYVIVEDLEAALARVRELRGEVVTEQRAAGGGTFAVIRDPAGAVCGLYQAG
ncbi:MAG: VOC family protein [Phycisphaerales bacterium JB041]